MIVMDDLQKAEDVWNNIHFSQVMDVDDEEMRRLMNRDIPLSELKTPCAAWPRSSATAALT